MAGRIERIRIFLTVARLGSFAQAARELGLSRSIATRQVAELEADLGVQLLARSTRKVAFTTSGRIYAEQVGPIASALDRADEDVRSQHGSLKGELKVSVPMSFGTRFLPNAVSAFRRLHPEIELRLHLSDRFVSIEAEGFDMVLRISGPPDDKTTIWRKICEVPRIMVASSEYLARKGVPKGPQELSLHDCLSYDNHAGGHVWQLSRDGVVRSVTIAPCLDCNNGDALATVAANGTGIALLPHFIVADALEAGHLIRVLPAWSPPAIWLTACYPPYDKLPTKVATFTNFIEQALSEDR